MQEEGKDVRGWTLTDLREAVKKLVFRSHSVNLEGIFTTNSNAKFEEIYERCNVQDRSKLDYFINLIEEVPFHVLVLVYHQIEEDIY